ncbi:DedA family protein [Patescibacteria group bacterium]|nr:DedA family protein [Patescibacteria group bacterium]MBU1682747.1 DedA family protein [Patescibacteria group bacterium]
MNKPLKEFFKYASLPIILLVIFAMLTIFYKIFDLPSYGEITAWVKDMFMVHGYWVVFLGAVAEGLLFANWYLPGSVVVVMGVAFAQESGLNVLWIVTLIVSGFMITAVINYALGRYGWYRLLMKFGLADALNKTKKRVEKHGLKIIFGTYFHPNIGALTSTSAGILHLSFYRFLAYSALALVTWNAFWAMVVYISGPAIVEIVNYKNLLLILGSWLIVLAIVFIWKRKKILIPATEESEE